jgi:hypothetical protein
MMSYGMLRTIELVLYPLIRLSVAVWRLWMKFFSHPTNLTHMYVCMQKKQNVMMLISVPLAVESPSVADRVPSVNTVRDV